MARRWTTSEDEQLRTLYDAGQPRWAIAEEIGRSVDAIAARRRLLAHPKRAPTRQPWTAREDGFLRVATSAAVPAPEIPRRLGRSAYKVKERRIQLRITRPPTRQYLPAENGQIQAAAAAGSLSSLAHELGRSEGGLRLHARKLGLIAPRERRRRWSSDEDTQLRAGYNAGLSIHLIHTKLLPHRTPGATAVRAQRLGLATFSRRWTTDEERRLTALAAALVPPEAIAKTLHRSREAIIRHCHLLQISLPANGAARTRKRWSDSEDELLRCNPDKDTRALAELTGRPEPSIRRRRKQLGLTRSTRSKHHTPPSNPDPGRARPATTARTRTTADTDTRPRSITPSRPPPTHPAATRTPSPRSQFSVDR